MQYWAFVQVAFFLIHSSIFLFLVFFRRVSKKNIKSCLRNGTWIYLWEPGKTILKNQKILVWLICRNVVAEISIIKLQRKLSSGKNFLYSHIWMNFPEFLIDFLWKFVMYFLVKDLYEFQELEHTYVRNVKHFLGILFLHLCQFWRMQKAPKILVYFGVVSSEVSMI